MKKKILLGTLAVLGIIWLIREKKTNKNKKRTKTEYRIDSPQNLFGDICKEFITTRDFKDEKDLFYKIIKEFGKYCPTYEWYQDVPVTYVELLDKLRELGLYEVFVLEVEEKYKKTRN